MALFLPQSGTKAQIDALPIVDGQLLWTTDQTENKIYFDNGTQRINLNGDKTKTATSVTITDTNNYFTSGNVEGALSETGMKINELEGYIGYTSSDIYGVEVDVVNKTFTRLAGAVGKTAGTNFNSINAFGGRKRCNLTDSGVVTAYYGETAYTETGALTQQITKNGTTYPIGTPVQVMVEQPKFYYKVVPLALDKVEGGKGFHMRKARYYVSDTAKAGFKLHPAFIVNGQENEKIYVSAFEGSLWDASASTYILDDSQVADFTADMLSSIANAKPMSGITQDLTRAKTRLLAEKRGTGWEQATVQTAAASELLMLIEYASFNMQSAIGQGAVNKTDDGKTNMAENTGATTNLGNVTGAVTNVNGFNVISYRGEENFFGNIWKFIDGININAKGIHEAYIADNSFADNKLDGVYSSAGITLAKSNGYVSAFGYNEDYDWLFLASETLGNSSLPVGDYLYQDNTYNGIMIALLGGAWYNGAHAGGFCWNVAYVSGARGRGVGGRLLYVPQ